MKSFVNKYIVLFFVLTAQIFTTQKVAAQIHDFDSLILHDTSFEQIASAIGDTLDLFNDPSVLEVTLETDFKNLVKRKYKDEDQEAIFTIMFNDTVKVTRNIKISPRGHMRKSTCLIPPLKLNFPKKKAFIKQMQSFDKLKMVLDCKRSGIYEQYLLSEYYTYKMQNIITDYSLRVRLMHVSYKDVSGKFKDVSKYAFIIENIDQLAERKNSIRIKTESIRDVKTHLPTLADAYLFQYLIGNTDWSIPAMHNIYMVKSTDPMKPTPYVIPYDFDYAGIVNTNYAVPDENLGTESVRERVYRGVCIGEEELLKSRNRFLDKKKWIYQTYEDDILLTKSYKRSNINYIEEFYNILDSDAAFDRHIVNNCR